MRSISDHRMISAKSGKPNLGKPQIPATIFDAVEPIRQLHRHHDGFVTFHHHDEQGMFRNLLAIRADKFARHLPALASDLKEDAYFSINAFSKPKGGHSTDEIGPPLRDQQELRYFCAC